MENWMQSSDCCGGVERWKVFEKGRAKKMEEEGKCLNLEEKYNGKNNNSVWDTVERGRKIFKMKYEWRRLRCEEEQRCLKWEKEEDV